GGDGCSANCSTVEPLHQCLTPGDACERCGNGNVVGTEQCDDGNNASGDGCRADCRVEKGWECASGACFRCGDGVVQDSSVGGVEGCDDGNAQSGDGCSATCTVEEPGFVCTTPGQLCEECGNHALESSETCDDGNAVDGDG